MKERNNNLRFNLLYIIVYLSGVILLFGLFNLQIVRSRVDLPLPIFPVKTSQLCSFIFRLTLSNKTLSLIFREKSTISIMFITHYRFFELY